MAKVPKEKSPKPKQTKHLKTSDVVNNSARVLNMKEASKSPLHLDVAKRGF